MTAGNRLSGEMFGKTPSLVVLKAKKRPEEKPVLPENSYHTLSCRQPFIMMMWATGFRKLYYLSKVWQLHRSRFSTVHPQRQMRAPAMIIFEIAHQDSFQMTIVQHDNMIQAITEETRLRA